MDLQDYRKRYALVSKDNPEGNQKNKKKVRDKVMPLVYHCLICGIDVPEKVVVKDNRGYYHLRGTIRCGPVDIWEQDRKEDWEEIDESETNV